MKNQTNVINTQLILSDDEKHRYLFFREWDKEKPIVTIITINAGMSDGIQTDQTTLLITNNVFRHGFGGFFAVNLFSGIGVKPKATTPIEDLFDSETDRHITRASETSEKIILAWGQIGNNNTIASARIKEVLKLLDKHKSKLHVICDETGRTGLHPLTPSVRGQWKLIPFASQEKKATVKQTPESQIKTTIKVNTKKRKDE